MTTFEQRRQGYENKFAHDEDLRFKAMARRNRLLGKWAAERLGISGEAADFYASEVVVADLQERGDGDVIRKVQADFEAKGVSATEDEIKRKLEEFLVEAMSEIEGS